MLIALHFPSAKANQTSTGDGSHSIPGIYQTKENLVQQKSYAKMFRFTFFFFFYIIDPNGNDSNTHPQAVEWINT